MRSENRGDKFPLDSSTEEGSSCSPKGVAMNLAGLTFLPLGSHLASSFPGRGVNEVKKPPSKKIGVVNVSEIAPGKWRLRVRSGRLDHRWTISDSFAKVKEIADELTRQKYTAKGLFSVKAVPSIREALAETVRLSARREESRRESGFEGAVDVAAPEPRQEARAVASRECGGGAQGRGRRLG